MALRRGAKKKACNKNKCYIVWKCVPVCVCVWVCEVRRKQSIRCGRVSICFISISASFTLPPPPLKLHLLVCWHISTVHSALSYRSLLSSPSPSLPLFSALLVLFPARTPAVIARCLIVHSELSGLLPLETIKVPFEGRAIQCRAVSAVYVLFRNNYFKLNIFFVKKK